MKAVVASVIVSIWVIACRYETVIHQQPAADKQVDLEEGVEAPSWYSDGERQQIKIELNIVIPPEPSETISKEQRAEIVDDLKVDLSDKVKLAQKADVMLGIVIRYSAFTLRQKGYGKEAKEIEDEYLTNYKGYSERFALGLVSAIGDHPPMWVWLDGVEKKLRSLLGDSLMKLTRLEDLRTFNYGLPIALQPAGDERVDPTVVITKLDYKSHYVPLAGVTGYWTTWGTCTGATYGAGSIAFICTPAATLVERVVVKRIAPDLSDKVWDRANQ